ncbi:MAG: DUF2807 domain-containing protein [Saprospiraceae bacterium]|nr:DUF2807 domain-containing protein [Saprospiraceae bacterium]
MRIISLLLFTISLIPLGATSQTEIIRVAKFNKIIVNPHIEANLMEGDEQLVEIIHSNIARDKINIKVEGKTLRIYLDDAKVITKSKKVKGDKWRTNRSIYEGTMATVNIT